MPTLRVLSLATLALILVAAGWQLMHHNRKSSPEVLPGKPFRRHAQSRRSAAEAPVADLDVRMGIRSRRLADDTGPFYSLLDRLPRV